MTGYLLTRFARDLGSLMALLDALDRFALSEQRAVTEYAGRGDNIC